MVIFHSYVSLPEGINEALNGITMAPNFGSQDGEGIPPNVLDFFFGKIHE
jgi:hypothetical protein